MSPPHFGATKKRSLEDQEGCLRQLKLRKLTDLCGNTKTQYLQPCSAPYQYACISKADCTHTTKAHLKPFVSFCDLRILRVAAATVLPTIYHATMLLSRKLQKRDAREFDRHTTVFNSKVAAGDGHESGCQRQNKKPCCGWFCSCLAANGGQSSDIYIYYIEAY